MPVVITTYNSDEDELADSKNTSSFNQTDSDQEDDQPLSKLIASSKSISATAAASGTSTRSKSVNSHGAQLSSTLSLNMQHILPPLSDSEDSDAGHDNNSLKSHDSEIEDHMNDANDDDNEDFSDLAEEFASLPLTELISSKQFASIRNRRRRRQNSKSIFSAYVLFFLDNRDTVKIENPDADFSDLSKIIQTKWDQLPKNKKKEYKNKSQCLTPDQFALVQSYKSQLTDLCNNNTPKQCSNPKCTNPTAYDPRWNGQYCSPICVSQHCRDVFATWCDSRRRQLTDYKSDQVLQPDLAFNALKVSGDDLQSPLTSIGSSEQHCTLVSVTPPPNDSVMQRRPLFESLREAAMGNNKVLNTSRPPIDIPLTRC